MNKITMKITDQVGTCKCEKSGEGRTVMVFKGEYEVGDRIWIQVPEVNCFYVIQIDDCMEPSLVYVTKPELEFEIPFEEKKISYNPKAFTGERHYLAARKAEDYEVYTYRNLAKNNIDQHGDHGCYPHARANVETRGEAVFAARNAIDGMTANESHGRWPFQSWGINRQDDAEFTLEFGRPVDFDTIVLYTRADFPHDNWWVEADITFSDGTAERVHMEKSTEPHRFSIEKQGITWLKLSRLIKADDPSPFPALTQIEVYGGRR